MTSKLKCPFCGGEFDIISIKRKMLGCPKCLHIADGAFWKKAIQAKQDLEIATKALVFVKTLNERQDGCFEEDYETQMRTVYEALEQIEHKERTNERT